jgi:hypothetical protein
MKNISTASLQLKGFEYNDNINVSLKGATNLKNTLKKIYKNSVVQIIGMALATLAMFMLFFYLVFSSWTTPINNEQIMHQQYQNGKSEKMMNEMKQRDQEDKNRAECGFTDCKQVYDNVNK